MSLPQFRRPDGSSAILARMAGAVAILLLALLVYLSADPEAHERFHHDAGHEDHHCVITDFATGEAFYLAPRFEVRPAVGVFFEVVPCEASDLLQEPVDYVLLPTCGPPSRGLAA